ncbi:pyrroline-5-carboxylate reductase [Pseudomonas sp. StFLB209]|uniref:pyrroline-5-carboxylate reductase family protein n=1 Tax=Pseudomonas sp. StFLB209 TaxID=1028989 RepID=UPI0004F6ED6F|nr:NAD(P)-binding domain-containing protein [Pseudomonas sp. StFLB209]BAP41618.1 pyrroline-5-carboxylate reductase [Pseudomonas sp. StFLB209]
MHSIGILGVGELTEKLVRGLRNGGFDGPILLSPRNRERAAALLADYGCSTLQSNAAVAEQAQLLVVGVRPADLVSLAAEVQVRPGQWLVSVVAGESLSRLAELFPGARCVRVMLSYAAEFGQSTVALTPPTPELEPLLGLLGRLVVLADDTQFELGTVAACMNGWFYFLLHDLQEWLADKGLPQQQARQLVLSSLKDCLACSEEQQHESLKALGERIATPGTYTADGLALLNHSQAGAQWKAACEVVLDALLSRSAGH